MFFLKNLRSCFKFIPRQKFPGWHAAQVTQVGHGMKVLDNNGKLRELQYHPQVIKGKEKRLTIKINNNEYEQTDEFRELQESRRKGNNDEQQYHSGEKWLEEDDKRRLGDIFRKQLNAAGNNAGIADGILNAGHRTNSQYTIRKNVSGKLFHDIFEIARSYTLNGELVDIHDNYDDCICYLSEDGTSGFAIEQETGNLVSVFNLGVRKVFLFSIKDYIRKEGATHLDAYASNKQDLRKIYEKTLGAKVAASMDYNMEYDHDNIAKNHGNPEIVFMVFGDDIDNKDVEEKHFNKDQYDEAENYSLTYNIEQAAYAEVMIPRWSNLIPNTPEALEMIQKEGLDIQLAYRIPTEGKQSVSIVKVVGFLDDVYGSTIMLPDEWVTQTGSDFDVDSVYGICHSLKVLKDKNGNIKRIKKYSADDFKTDYAKYKYYIEDNINNKISSDIEDDFHEDKYKVLSLCIIRSRQFGLLARVHRYCRVSLESFLLLNRSHIAGHNQLCENCKTM